MKYSIEVRSDLVVVGFNPENADMDRPNGEVIGERFYMHAQDALGHAKVWGWFSSAEICERNFVNFAPAIEEWSDGRPGYGTPAWEAVGQNGLDADAERDAYDCPRQFEVGAFHRVY
jgi:hypothetical protein